MISLFTDHLLTWIILVPFLGIAVLALVRDELRARQTTLACTLLNLGLFLTLWFGFDTTQQGMQFVDRMTWMPTLSIQYAVGVDGISLILLLLTIGLAPICVLCSWSSVTRHVRAFMMLVLLVEGAMVVVFSSLDLFQLFMFWELTMIPMYFLIILWGGPNRIAAGLKFVLYSLTGSLLLLVGILTLYLQGGGTFDIITLSQREFTSTAQWWMFLAFCLSFAIKLPMLPFHTWLPDSHAEAPTAGSVILAGILLKMGGYGFLRICLPMFPDASATFAPLMVWLSVAGILYGGVMALAQDDLKKLIAYSSISHMGFVTLGIFSFSQQGIEGAILQMFNHGIVTGAIFVAVGQLYERTHDRSVYAYGGLHKQMPRFACWFSLFVFASFGLPGTGSFIGEFLVLVGASEKNLMAVLLALVGILLAASYMLWMLQRVVLGQPSTQTASLLPDLTMRESASLVALATVVLWIGLYPSPLIRSMENDVANIVQLMNEPVDRNVDRNRE
ncbi:complex I subunit 4 family protein [Stieleria varia]|uniref:NADH-quinone oxidoreductase subunit M n=1 Tax=Stieleria varia TaxID=2528005 RepID=A0A5C6B1Z5_9BACT|nr:NADH-quinone oxidoreductase subunit M [Stieleria varia]TWU06153.1 NADH-quinone oxidoreductase subunit M [Stieleria varia]